MNHTSSPVVGGHWEPQLRRRKAAVSAVVDALERRLMFTGTLTPIATFDGTNGVAPAAAVEDTSGNIFGVTEDSLVAGQPGPGELFEIKAGTNTITVLATFGNTEYEGGSLIIDSAGNLYGTEIGVNGSGLPGLVFEVTKGTSTITTLATMPGYQGTFGENPGQGYLMAVNGSGDLFGTDEFGNPFEIVQGSGTVTYLTQVPSDGLGPVDAGDLIVAPDGTLFGTTFAGGVNSAGSIFEIPAGTMTIDTLASFDASTTGSGPLGVAMDSAGDLLGFCENGGPNSDGTAFELPSGSSTISLLGSFTAATGDTPVTKPVLGASGNLYGLTEDGGANGFGTFFDIATGDTPAAAAGLQLGDTPNRSIRPISPLDDADSFSDGADLNNDQVAGPGSVGIIPDDPGDYTDDVKTEVAVLGKAFGETDDSPGGYGAIDKYTPSSPTPPPAPTPPPSLKQMLKNDANEIADIAKSPLFEPQEAAPVPAPQNPPGLNGGIVRPGPQGQREVRELPATPASGQTSLSGLRAQLKAMLATAKAELKAATPLVNRQTVLTGQYDSETKILTALEAQLASTTKPSSQTLIQKKITADQAVATRLLDEDTSVYNSANADLSDVSTQIANIQSAIASAPAATVILNQTITSVPGSMSPGKKAVAAVTISNSGSAQTSGSLKIALWARPAGTTGSADIALPTVTVKIKIKAGGSANERLSFLVPAALAAGSYSLVAQLESGPPNLTVGAQTFTVT